MDSDSRAPRTIELSGMSFAAMSSHDLLDHMFAELAAGRGGWVVTANLDILRRHRLDQRARDLYDAADLRVADGMPLVWASRVQGEPLPERVAGSSLTPRIAERAAAERRSLFLLGGEPGAADEAAETLKRWHPSLEIAGVMSPWVGNPPTESELDRIVQEVDRYAPDIVLVAFGSPKQEHVCLELRRCFPGAWSIGVGISLSFVAGRVQRAPAWMQQVGLEWVHRLAQEPKRLARRYLIEDLPFATVLFADAARARLRRR